MSNFIIKINSSKKDSGKEFLELKANKGFKSISKYNFDISYKETDLAKCDSYENENNFCFIKYSKITDRQKSQRSKTDNYAQIAINHFETNGCCFNDMRGDFSIFIYDKKQKKFFVFSDHMHLSPIFYAEIENTTLITSDLSLILQCPDFKKDRNHAVIQDYLDLKTPCIENTFYKGLKKIPPRNLLIISSKGMHFKPYKKLKVIPSINKFDIDKTINTFRDIFLRTVKEHSISKKKVGLQFSGGLDSSSILVALKHQKSKTKIFSYTARFNSLPEFEREKISEEKYQDGCLKGSNVHTRFYDQTKKTTLSELDTYLKIFRQPFYFPHLSLIEESYKMAKNDEIEVIMSGMDGDSVLSYGYEYLPYLFKNLSWIKLFSILQKIKLTHKIAFFSALNHYVLQPILEEVKIFFENNFKNINTPNFNSMHPSIFHINMMEHSNRYDAIEKLKLLGNHYNLFVSHPFYDEDLIDFCISVNPEFKIYKGYSRYVLREAIKDLLPAENYKRITKSDIGICFLYQMREIDNEIIEYNFENPSGHIKDYLDLDSLLKEWNYFKNSTCYTFDQQTISSKIFVFVCLNVWLKKEFP